MRSRALFAPSLHRRCSQVGTISRTIGPNLVNIQCQPYVYVLSGANVVSGAYTYRTSFLEAGNYTVSFACLTGKTATVDLSN